MLVTALFVGATGLVVPVAHAAPDQVTCQTYTLPVSLTDNGSASSRISGELCATNAERHSGSTIQVLVHGITYNHTYWDFGYQNAYYSYARHLAAAGYATFAYDRIGDGASTRPSSTSVGLTTGAVVAHQVIQALQSGALTGTRFGKVIEVGHSFGSNIAWMEVSMYHDVDGLIVTGALHHVNLDFLAVAYNDLYPAYLDPLFQSISSLDPGYFTTVPGSRASLFYNPSDADPAVIAFDEAHKDLTTGGEIAGAGSAPGDAQLTASIHAPVLLIQGASDFLFCDATYDCSSAAALVRQESPFYPSTVCLEAVSVPSAGHDISLHVNHWYQEAAALSWSDRFIGRRAGVQPAPGCGA